MTRLHRHIDTEERRKETKITMSQTSKKIIAVNAGPRKGWNTDRIITEASEGAESMLV